MRLNCQGKASSLCPPEELLAMVAVRCLVVGGCWCGGGKGPFFGPFSVLWVMLRRSDMLLLRLLLL